MCAMLSKLVPKREDNFQIKFEMNNRKSARGNISYGSRKEKKKIKHWYSQNSLWVLLVL